MKRSTLVLLLMALLLFACGGGDPEDDRDQIPESPTRERSA